MGHTPIMAEALARREAEPLAASRAPPPAVGAQSYTALVTPVIGRVGIGVDRGSLCTYIRH